MLKKLRKFLHMAQNDYQIAIIGGGPAGSTAAIYLSDAGFNTCIIEKKSFPRETLCGEFLSKEVVEILSDLNLKDEFLSLNPNLINSFRFFNQSGENIFSKLDFPAYGLKRSTFDNFLLSAAKRRGVTIFQPADVRNIEFDEGKHLLTISNNNNSSFLTASTLIAAYGKQNSLDRTLNRTFAEQKSGLNGVKFHIEEKGLRDFDDNEIHVYAGNGIYCGVNAVNDNLVTVCFLEDRKTYRKTVRQHLIDLLEVNRSFKKLFSNGFEKTIRETHLYGTGNIYFGFRNLVQDGIYFIGDSAGVIAPLAGDGIGMAMETGKLLSQLFIKQREEKINNTEMEHLYINSWKSAFQKRLKSAKMVQDIVLHNLRRNLGFSFVKLFPPFLPYLINVTRH